jgi:predicted GNAT family acetyltransferase
VTDSLLRRARSRVALAPVHLGEVDEALELCSRNPVAYIMPTMHLEHAQATGRMASGQLWGVRDRGERSAGIGRGRDRSSPLVGVLWTGANLVPALPDTPEERVDTVADAMLSQLARPGALVGEAAVVLRIWERVEKRWGPARDLRPEQLLMVLRGAPVRPAPPGPGELSFNSLRLEPVRIARLTDFDALLPAAVHMFIGEVGYDPLEHGRAGYEDRLRRLIRLGRSYLQFGVVDGVRQVVFKTEAGVVGGGVAELQGVWVHPTLRGRGFGRAGVVAVVDLVQGGLAPTVSLYVNDYNERAVRTYEAVGFERVGTFATIMV